MNGSVVNDSNTIYNSQTYLYYDCHNMDVSYPFYGIYLQNWFVVGTLNVILSPLTFFINLLTLIALRGVKDKNTITNCILANLCATDMLTGLLGQSVYGAHYLNVYHNKKVCSLYLTTIGSGYFFVTVSFFTLFSIQTERYAGVFYPFHYEKVAEDEKFIRRILTVTWLISGILLLVSFFTPHLILHTFVAAIIVPIVFIWSCYVQVKIVRQIHKITRRIRKDTLLTDDKRKDISRINSRANRLAGLILMAHIICYTPNIIICMWRYFNPNSNNLLAALVWTETLVFLNSIFNALLFCLQKKDVRRLVIYRICSLVPCSIAICEPQHDASTCHDRYYNPEHWK